MYKEFSSFWDLLFQFLFPGGYLTIKQGYWITLIIFGISTLSLLLQMKFLGKKKTFYTILLNFGLLAITMFIPALLGLYTGFLLSNGIYSIKAHRNSLSLLNKILIGVLNSVGILALLGACGIFIFFWRYMYDYMLVGGLVVGVLLYLITPIRAFYFSIPENLSPSRMKKVGLATGISFIVLTSILCCFGFIRPYDPAPDTYTPSSSMDITVVTYNIRQGTGREKNEYDFWNYRKDDIAIVMDHFILAATDQGLGTCWVAAFNAQKAREILELPDEVEPLIFTPLGYPADTPGSKERKPLSDLIRYNRW